jgi:transcriptional regulator
MIEVIKNYPLATLISIKNNTPCITHLPLVYNTSGNLIGHIDKFNPHAELLKNNNKISVIFSGPQCYISPTIYTTRQLPTWNYIKVHLNGRVQHIESHQALKESLISMTEFLEAPEHKYVLESDNKSMNSYLNYIAMFEITIDSWEGKFKLSQDKTLKDIEAAKNELIDQNKKDISKFLDTII